ncbi:glycosyltransferase family 2 protein [Algoriphagus persicinus]|uniref:glycosyltransferase family 2 protein n=1 Tax=Algoriphagus persicinus TaxID=3108754 RepID=UPI002B3A4341|nr:glycosyltransferase family 2 protein [Algoriphagus sp. E1-3-M2]MEB2785133.1 glycosyltransferase family 2 protein [Algoriphagus sp. E1-3-M2]
MQKAENSADFLVSVIVPVYNTAQFILDCIKSVQRQTYHHWELVLVDDRSTDRSWDICTAAAAEDSRIKVFIQEKNSGALASRNKGIEEAKGRFVCFLDSDDTYEPSKIETQLSFMLKEKHAVSFTMFQRITESGEYMGKGNVGFTSEISYQQLLGNPQFSIITLMLDSAQVSIPLLKLDLLKAEDYVFHLAILKQGFKAYGIDKALSNYRYRIGSQSTSFMGNAADLWKVLYSIEKLGLLSATYYFSRYITKGLKKKMILMSQIKQVRGN